MNPEIHDPSEERETFGDMFAGVTPEEISEAIDSTIARWEGTACAID